MNKHDILDVTTARAHSAAHKGSAVWEDAVERLTPLLDQAAMKVTPVARQAKSTAAHTARMAAGFAADQVERIQPNLNSALDRVPGAVDRAQRAIQDDLVPRLVAFLRTSAAAPTSAGHEARAILAGLDQRTNASVTALQQELVKVEKRSSKKKGLAVLVTVGAVTAALAIAVKTFLGSRDDWAEYEPDEPYVYPDDDPEIDIAMGIDDSQADEAVAESSPYGDGSYKGPTPPEGYVIKGNERSMKYHVPGSTGYARTNGDVWFDSEAAAEAAGFARSMR